MEKNYQREEQERLRKKARTRNGIRMMKREYKWLLLLIGEVVAELLAVLLLNALVSRVGIDGIPEIIYRGAIIIFGIILVPVTVYDHIRKCGVRISNRIENCIMLIFDIKELEVNDRVTHPFLYSYDYNRKDKTQELRIYTLIDIELWKKKFFQILPNTETLRRLRFRLRSMNVLTRAR